MRFNVLLRVADQHHKEYHSIYLNIKQIVTQSVSMLHCIVYWCELVVGR